MQITPILLSNDVTQRLHLARNSTTFLSSPPRQPLRVVTIGGRDVDADFSLKWQSVGELFQTAETKMISTYVDDDTRLHFPQLQCCTSQLLLTLSLINNGFFCKDPYYADFGSKHPKDVSGNAS